MIWYYIILYQSKHTHSSASRWLANQKDIYKERSQSDVPTEFHDFASQALCSNTGNSHSNWKRSRNRSSKGFGIHSNRKKPRYRIWIEHSYFATFLRATKKIHWFRLLEMLYLTMTFKWGVNEDIEILGSKATATFFDPSGRNHPLEEGQGRIFKRWMRTGGPIARDQYRWMHDGKSCCWPAGFKELFFVFSAPHSYWYWLCFPCLPYYIFRMVGLGLT